MQIFSLKKVKFKKNDTKSVSFKVCSIACYTPFPFFGQFENITAVKIFPFYCEPFMEPFFHIFAQTKALLSKDVIHRCKQVAIGRSQVW